jgi:hypothetical protein
MTFFAFEELLSPFSMVLSPFFDGRDCGSIESRQHQTYVGRTVISMKNYRRRANASEMTVRQTKKGFRVLKFVSPSTLQSAYVLVTNWETKKPSRY